MRISIKDMVLWEIIQGVYEGRYEKDLVNILPDEMKIKMAEEIIHSIKPKESI